VLDRRTGFPVTDPTPASPPPSVPRRARALAGRLLLLLGGLVAGFLLLEAALQAVAVVRRSGEDAAPITWRGDGTRVLAVGDSNTYGIYAERDQTYPAVFEARWNLLGGRRVDVLNLGRPGMNSTQAKALVDATLGELRPEVVFLMIGANDFWTPTASEVPLWGRSRVVRLLTMAWRALTRAAVIEPATAQRITVGDHTVEIGGTGYVAPVRDWEEILLANVRAISDATRAAGVRLVLLTYPADDDVYGTTNRRIRRLARETGVPLIDVGLALRRRCPTVKTPLPDCEGFDCWTQVPAFSGVHERCGLLLPDGHPTVEGYAAVAQTVVDGWTRLHAGDTAARGRATASH